MPVNELDQPAARAAIKIQTAFRFFSAQKKYKISPILPSRMTSGFVFPVGNDPAFVMPEALKSAQRFAIVATSCLRVLDIARQICADNTDYIPLILVIDINAKVKEFWSLIQKYCDESGTLPVLTDKILDNKDKLIEFVGQVGTRSDWKLSKIIELLCHVSNGFGFDRLRKMVKNTVSITHDWTDPRLFNTIKNIFNFRGFETVYVYPSNILSCISDARFFNAQPVVTQMLKNIATLNPVASIYSDYVYEKNGDKVSGFPRQVQCYSGAGVVDHLERTLGEREARKTYCEKLSKEFSLFFSMKNFSDALTPVYIAYQFYSELPDIIDAEKTVLSDITHNLGACLQELSSINYAAFYLQQALALRESVGHPEIQATNERLQQIPLGSCTPMSF